jgi:hypothetical protein
MMAPAINDTRKTEFLSNLMLMLPEIDYGADARTIIARIHYAGSHVNNAT